MTEMTASSPARRALLLIDFQDDFIEADGRMPVCRSHVEPALAAAQRAVAKAREAGDLIVTIGNEFRPGDHLMNLLRRRAAMAGSSGARWTQRLMVEDAVYFPKWAGSAFVNADLEPWLRRNGVTALALCGLKARACVRATATDALAKGFSVELIAQAIACDSDSSRRRSLQALGAKGASLVGATA